MEIWQAVPLDSQTASFETPTAEIGLRAVTISWDRLNMVAPNDIASAQSENNFKLHIPDEVIFKPGRINLIVGRTGSGKTAMLMALLGEMHYVPLGPNCLVSLPRHGGIAYHAQESWVLSETIRPSMKKVIYQCALEQDLALFAANDETEVGERGITLSGGQKARITLARAVYSAADILLLDDVLAALDVYTARWIVDKCFRGDLVKGRTVILVTHNLALVSPIAENVVALRDGRVISQGSLTTALENDDELSAEALKDEKEVSQAESNSVQPSSEVKTKTHERHAGKLVVKEEVAEVNLFFSNTGLGLSGVAFFWVFFLLPAFMSKLASVLDNWVLGLWARQYETHEAQEVSVT
ncbi:hypothetical protein EIP86_003487 [Pleurotus ostreatoroseus]|nr:hypothetical protein EIP86_003487 [Pleurotus ostreatoroseus]